MFLIIRMALKGLLRDWRSGELRLISLAILVATASYTSVSFFTDRVNRATEIQATELLAADLVVRSAEPISASLVEQARDAGLQTALTVSFRSVVVHADNLQLAEVKAVDSGYPLRGQMRISGRLFSAEQNATTVPAPGTAWPDARLYQLLQLDVQQDVTVGAAELTAARVLTYEPDRGGDMFNIAPRLLMNLDDLDSTGLILPGSRVAYRLLLAGTASRIAAFRKMVEADDTLRIQGIRDARPELRTALERAEQFLGLAVIVSIALAGLAMAMSARRYASRHIDNCAIMRCFGVQQRTITALYATQLLLLALCFSSIGIVLGYLGQAGLAHLMQLMVKGALPGGSAMPVLSGFIVGLITVLGFAMPQILRLARVAPLRVLRRDLEPAGLGNTLVYLLAVIALVLLTPWQSGNLRLTAYGFGGILVAMVLLFLGARFLIRQVGRYRSRLGVAVRFGLANISRRSTVSTIQILGIGLGLMVLTLLTLIRTDLLASWRDKLPDNTPNYFLINIQPQEVDSLSDFIRDRTGITVKTAPMIRGRLLTINNNPVSADNYEDPRAKRFATRVFNLSVAGRLKEDNRLVDGEWWDEDNRDKLFSFEEEFAKTLRISVGDVLAFNIGGKTLTGSVSSLRWVDWDTFNVNFFAVANPGTLDGFAGTWVTSFYLPGADKQLLIDLVRNYPSITIFDVDSILRQVRQIMTQVIRAVEFVFGFTLLAGFIVLLAALQTTHDERRYESALLNALGAGRRYILVSSTIEFSLLGLLAGLIAAITATGLELVLAEFVFKISVTPNLWSWLIVPVISVLIVIGGGLIGMKTVLSTPPMVALRKT